MTKTIELVKGKDGVYREGKTEPQQATFKNPVRSKRINRGKASRGYSSRDLAERVTRELNDTLEEIGMQALNELTRGFFK